MYTKNEPQKRIYHIFVISNSKSVFSFFFTDYFYVWLDIGKLNYKFGAAFSLCILSSFFYTVMNYIAGKGPPEDGSAPEPVWTL
jgi:hypothetical protein